FLSLTEGSLTNTEVTYCGTLIVDRLNRAPVGRAAQLGLSLLWLWALGHRRGAGHCRPRAAPHRPTLRGPDRPGRQVSGAESSERTHASRLGRPALPGARPGACYSGS